MAGIKFATPAAKPDEYRNVFVFLETREDKLIKPALEMIGVGKKIADKVGEKLYCVLLGKDIKKEADEAASYGCDVILGAESPDLGTYRTLPYSRIISDFVKEEKPNIFLIPATRNGRDLASRIAVSCEAGVTADCTELDIEQDTRILSANRPTYGESMLAEILCKKHRPQMATARPGIFPVPEKVKSPKGEIRIKKANIDPSLLKKEVLEFRKKNTVDLTDSKVVVSGGMGLGKPEGFGILKELAGEIGGVVGSSRPAVDMGWITRDHQVGQTGQTVRPRLYIAAGISGKIQHIMGMKNSETILSINTDPGAEILKYSDYVINADLYEAIPALINSIREKKKSPAAAAKK
ncbi:MAG: electron transfer flavoprotein subunit alpha/FixB family protein [Candidatus Thermoplasmatota archaeon]|nr:electron transfer flavoprotein subunit alpha/FixB family protein [Candidatus Thermoplasmatota archaeon]